MLLKNEQTRFCQFPPFSPLITFFNYLERVLQLLLSKKLKEKTLLLLVEKWHFRVISLKASQSDASYKMRSAVAEGSWNQRLAKVHSLISRQETMLPNIPSS